jgi:hypothetical protein
MALKPQTGGEERGYSPLRAAALSWKRLPRRMYLRTCFKERWRVCSMMERSEAPPSAAEVASPERSECPEKRAGVETGRAGEPLDDSRQLVIGAPSASLPYLPSAGNKKPSVIPDCASQPPSPRTGQLSGCEP